MYVNNLKQDMKLKLKEQGYLADNIEVEIEVKNEKNYGKIKSIFLKLYKDDEENEQEDGVKVSISINKINEVNISNTINNKKTNYKKEDLKNNEKNEIKKYLSSVYEVNKKNIKINE